MNMVEFITLFLGALFTGPNLVQFEVHEDVAALEIRLDAQPVAILREAPWEIEVDFGDALVPHLLEAVAYTADGRDASRASQWVNLAPQAAGTTITLDRGGSTDRVEARIHWETLSEDNQPVAARAFFDGEGLPVDDPKIIILPPHDPTDLHHLRVELEFADSLQSSAEIAFGGHYGETVSSELTTFAIDVARRKLPDLEAMQTWFRSNDQPLRVHAVEKGLAEIVVVRSAVAEQRLRRNQGLRDIRSTRPILAKDHRLRFLGIRPVTMARGESSFIVFPRSEEIVARVGGLREILGSVSLPVSLASEARVVDAVAVAGSFAHQSARRRAVVLITTGDENDASQFEVDQVQGYLRSLGVPLFVWTLERGKKNAGRWGPARNISTHSLLDTAYRSLSKELSRQRVVWLTGSHLPQSLEITPGIDGVQAVR